MNTENAENAANRISERLKFKISRGGGGMPPNAPSNSRLPQLAIWSGHGTALYYNSGPVDSPSKTSSLGRPEETTM